MGLASDVHTFNRHPQLVTAKVSNYHIYGGGATIEISCVIEDFMVYIRQRRFGPGTTWSDVWRDFYNKVSRLLEVARTVVVVFDMSQFVTTAKVPEQKDRGDQNKKSREAEKDPAAKQFIDASERIIAAMNDVVEASEDGQIPYQQLFAPEGSVPHWSMFFDQHKLRIHFYKWLCQNLHQRLQLSPGYEVIVAGVNRLPYRFFADDTTAVVGSNAFGTPVYHCAVVPMTDLVSIQGEADLWVPYYITYYCHTRDNPGNILYRTVDKDSIPLIMFQRMESFSKERNKYIGNVLIQFDREKILDMNTYMGNVRRYMEANYPRLTGSPFHHFILKISLAGCDFFSGFPLVGEKTIMGDRVKKKDGMFHEYFNSPDAPPIFDVAPTDHIFDSVHDRYIERRDGNIAIAHPAIATKLNRNNFMRMLSAIYTAIVDSDRYNFGQIMNMSEIHTAFCNKRASTWNNNKRLRDMFSHAGCLDAEIRRVEWSFAYWQNGWKCRGAYAAFHINPLVRETARAAGSSSDKEHSLSVWGFVYKGHRKETTRETYNETLLDNLMTGKQVKNRVHVSHVVVRANVARNHAKKKRKCCADGEFREYLLKAKKSAK